MHAPFTRPAPWTTALLLGAALLLGGCDGIADQLVDEARIEEATGREADAERSLSVALTIAPDHLRARVARASLRLLSGDAAGAAKDLTRVVELEPTHISAWMSLGVAHRRAGNAPRALEVLTTATSRWPREVAPRMLAASIAFETGDLAMTKVLAMPVLELDPAHPEVHQLLGDVAVLEKRWEDGLRHYFAATEAPDASAQALGRLAGLLLAGDRADQAIPVLERLVEQHPEEAAAARATLEKLGKNENPAQGPDPGETKPGNR